MPALIPLTHVALRVPDLPRSREYYARQLGFSVASETPDRVELATSSDAAPILSLIAGRHAAVPPRDAAGLFHAALLFPSRTALASWFAFAAAQHVEFEGFSDHGVSEAIYLSDPDGNGLEFYADRPRAEWPFSNGELAMTTRPLAVRELLAAAAPGPAPLADAGWGHLHLRVTKLERSEAFYRQTLGLEVTQRSYPGARFLAADGYHHHLGLNSWGDPRHPFPADALGLAAATFARPGVTRPTALADPDGIPLRLVPLPSAADQPNRHLPPE